jgi:hypothetical protein
MAVENGRPVSLDGRHTDFVLQQLRGRAVRIAQILASRDTELLACAARRPGEGRVDIALDHAKARAQELKQSCRSSRKRLRSAFAIQISLQRARCA